MILIKILWRDEGENEIYVGRPTGIGWVMF
jgi:hypothetical protein